MWLLIWNLIVLICVMETEPMDKDNEDDDDEAEEKKDEEEEGEGEKEEDADEGDLEDAWKMLEFARIIHEKNGTSTIETVDIITKLADLNCFKGKVHWVIVSD
jgi:hypothetical protein